MATLARAFALAAAVAGNLALFGIADAHAETRTLSFYHTHTGERATITFKRNGRYDEAGIRQMNQFLRDWRRNEVIRMDPALFDLVWEVYQQSGSRQPIHLVSSYRSPATNNMLRSRSRGVAKESMHTKGRAMDFFLPDVPPDRLRAIGLRKQIGGVGYYGGSGFTHLDTGRIRHWPRMSREQLARVFPDGKTVHVPSDGKPMPRYQEALAEIQRRGNGRSGTAFASNGATSDGSNVKQGNLIAMLFGGGSDEDEEGTTETPPPALAKRQPELRQGPLPTATPARPETPPAAIVAAAPAPPSATGRPLELASIPDAPAPKAPLTAALDLPAPPPAAPKSRPAPEPLIASAPPAAIEAPFEAAPAALPGPTPPVAVATAPTPAPAPERPSRLAALPPGWTVGPNGLQMPQDAPLAAPSTTVPAIAAAPAAVAANAPVPNARPVPPAALGFAPAEPPAATSPAISAPATVARLTPAPGIPLPQARPGVATTVAALAPAPQAAPVAPLPVAAPLPPTASPAVTATPAGRALLPPVPSTTASVAPTQGGSLGRSARVGAAPQALATFTSPLEVGASADMLDGSVTTRTKRFAQLERPSFESIPALITTPTQTIAKGFGAAAPYGAMRTDRFSGRAIAVLAVVVTGQ